jgi:hypothetical protein
LIPALVFSGAPLLQAQDIYASVHNGFGVSFVDAGNRLLTGQSLSNTNRFSWFGSIEGLYLLPSGYLLGVEFGAHRLYSYKWYDGVGNRTTTIVTYHPGAIVGIVLKDNFYIKAGVNLRAFSYGGVSPGAMIALDYALPLNDLFSIPLGLRSDIIIDGNIILSLNASIGLRYYINY